MPHECQNILLLAFADASAAPAHTADARWQWPKVLVYYDRVAGNAAPRYICRGRQKTEGRPHPVGAVVHIFVVHVTTVAHTERKVRKARITGNCTIPASPI